MSDNNDSILLSDNVVDCLSDFSVCIVGLGGTGSALCQTLAHVGVRKFILFDDDIINDKQDLKKLIGSMPQDMFKPKHIVMQRLIQNITGDAADVKIFPIKFKQSSNDDIKQKIIDADFVFLCVDNPVDSEYINYFCVQNKKPFMYLGVGMEEEQSKITSLLGNIILVRPGEPCLDCYNVNSKLPYGNRKIPYVFIHSIISNLAVMEFLKHVTGFGSVNHMVFYDALKQTVKSTLPSSSLNRCNMCKEMGY